MQVPPRPDDEEERQAALNRYGILDTAEEKAFDDLARLAAAVCGTPVALVTLLDHERQWFKSKVGLDLVEAPRDDAVCGYTLLEHEALQVPDLAADPRFADNPLVRGEPRFTFYAGTPLIDRDGHALGTLCVLDHVRRPELDAGQVAALEALGRQVVTLIELRQVAARFAALAESASDCVYVLQLAPVPYVDFVSPALTRMTGWLPAEVYGDPESLRRLVHQEEHYLLDAVLTGAATAEPVEMRFVHRDGGVCWTEHLVRTVFDEQGRPLTVYGVARDVTARRAAEDAVRAAQERASRARADRDALVSRVSHELRTPLNAILGFAQLLELDLKGEQAQSAGQIVRAGVHLLDLVDQVLSLGTAGDLAVTPLLLDTVAHQVALLLRAQAQERRVELEVEGSLQGLVALADGPTLEHALLALAGNALRYTTPGGCVRLSGARAGGDVLLEVTDTGPGLDEAALERLFTPFDRLDAEVRGVPGSGLGLAVSRSGVQQMGGDLTVRSSPGAGSVFTIRLPSAPGRPDDTPGRGGPSDILRR